MDWQPIDTAPRDGTQLLLWFDDGGPANVCWWDPTLSWTDGEYRWPDEAFTHWTAIEAPLDEEARKLQAAHHARKAS